MSLPKIEIIFKQKAVSAVKRSASGIVCLVVKDDTKKDFTVKELKSVEDLKEGDFSADNVAAIKDCLSFAPNKVIVIRIDVEGKLADALKIASGLKINWIGVVKGITKDHTDLSTWVKGKEKEGKTIKAVVFNHTANCKHVVNFATEQVTFKDERGQRTGDEYIPSILGILAGLPLTRSATYYKCSNLLSTSEVDDLETEVGKGKFLLFMDEGEVKVASAVNSLSEVTQDNTEDMKDIIIVESMDLITEDIRATFKEWIGKYKNKYENQILFISAVNSYLRDLMKEDILDNEYKNITGVDVEAQRNAWMSVGKAEAENWDEQTVKKNTFKKSVFLLADIKILNAVESFKLTVHMF